VRIEELGDDDRWDQESTWEMTYDFEDLQALFDPVGSGPGYEKPVLANAACFLLHICNPSMHNRGKVCNRIQQFHGLLCSARI
jgi:hypothetical protein